eukprot:scaffold205742_cov63-Attheya_sp.AAC.5
MQEKRLLDSFHGNKDDSDSISQAAMLASGKGLYIAMFKKGVMQVTCENETSTDHERLLLKPLLSRRDDEVLQVGTHINEDIIQSVYVNQKGKLIKGNTILNLYRAVSRNDFRGESIFDICRIPS